MTVEDRRGLHQDQFPVGLRVLAVDDDPVCLKLLEALLIRCQYNVTTTGQAVTALRLLRENKTKYDLVISDVHMPDMDGFKLLELVGLEMDLPVIMLSSNGETEAVMKGIVHGACDYLLKPVRIEELKNIWQHVIRRRTFDKRCQKKKDYHNAVDDREDIQKTQIANFEGGQRGTDQNEKINKKRKDQNENDEFESEDDMLENDEHSSQKKPRVVWTVELHRKFVAAVNHMGIDKAVPRKILDLMNVEKLTRENVASHLQKYRLYLKRISANQQANLTAAFGGRNSSYITSLNGFRGYQHVGRSNQSSVLASFQPNGILARTSAQTSIGRHGLLPSPAIHLGGINKNMSYNVNDTSKFQNLSLPRNDQANLLHGVPTVLQLEGSQKPRIMQELNSNFTAGLPSNNGVNAAICASSSQSGASNSLLRHASMQQQPGELYDSSSVTAAASISNSLGTDLQNSSQFPHAYRHNDNGQIAVMSTQHSASTLSKFAPIKQEAMSYSTTVGQLQGLARSTSAQNQVNSLVGNGMNIPTGVGENPSLTNFRVEDNLVQKRNDIAHNPVSSISAYSSFSNHQQNDATIQYQAIEQRLYNSKLAADVINSTVLDTSLLVRSYATDQSDSQLLDLDDYPVDTGRLQNGLNSTSCSFNELYAMIKPEQNGDDKLIDTDFGSDVYSLGTCI